VSKLTAGFLWAAFIQEPPKRALHLIEKKKKFYDSWSYFFSQTSGEDPYSGGGPLQEVAQALVLDMSSLRM